jgi:Arc/MetJ-type ribon-helix-helix transcriptional regulator
MDEAKNSRLRMKYGRPSEMMTARIPVDMHDQIKKIAVETDRFKSDVVVDLLREGLAKASGGQTVFS